MSEAMKQGKAELKILLQKEIPERRLTVMTETVANLETGDLDEMYDFLVNAEVVEGPPGFREIVAALWPELLHKVKPPISEMH